MFPQMMKQETVHLDEKEIPHCKDEEETGCDDYMIPGKQLQASDCVDNSDCKFVVLEELKTEFPEDEYLQPVSSKSSRSVFENEELSQVIVKQEFKQENSEESLSIIKNEVIDDELYPVVIKIESLEEHRVLDDCGDSGVHYDVLVTPQPVQCKLCSKTFKNRYSLLIHNNEHIKVVMNPTPVDIEMNELHKCKCCHEYFNSFDNMLAHIRDVHSNETHKSELYHEGIKPYLMRKNGEKMEYKCNLCERVYKKKQGLVEHMKKIHVEYERTFDCWCGKQFRSRINLSLHKKQHRADLKKIKKFKCDSCQKLFKTSWCLNRHVMSVHYDYGKTFECSCGEQFRTPMHLSEHKNRKHSTDKVNNKQYQCESCRKYYKSRLSLIVHIKKIHYDYGKTFECFCGKQFRTPMYLARHKDRQHMTDFKKINKFQCDSCHKCFKNKNYLTIHIKRIHYDYMKTFECPCGKQFRSPIHLSDHKNRLHCASVKKISNQQFQCDSCHKYFKTKTSLTVHIKRTHYDYSKTFECSCGKQFRTPNHLSEHKNRQICAGVKKINNQQYQCDSCYKYFKDKDYLIIHIKMMHYDYGKTFKCSCGKQFRSPIHLSRHKNGPYCDEVTKMNNQQFQCESCHKCFKNKLSLKVHAKTMHYDYGKTFKCFCGKQFRTPMYLANHKKRQHNINDNIVNTERFGCDYCNKYFDVKNRLIIHIKRQHYDHGKTFECSCGKQFRTPNHLSEHKNERHCTGVKKINNRQLQCDFCDKYFKTKHYLIAHVKRMHYDYGKRFECSCGKQFRTPISLSLHKKRMHNLDVKIINDV